MHIHFGVRVAREFKCTDIMARATPFLHNGVASFILDGNSKTSNDIACFTRLSFCNFKVHKSSYNRSRRIAHAVSQATTVQVEEVVGLEKEVKAATAIPSAKNTTFNIVFVSAEVAPYSKVGGLGDVAGTLPIAFAARGHRAMVVTPRYMNGVTDEKYSNAVDLNFKLKISCFGGEHEISLFHEYRGGVDWVFVDHPSFHRRGTPYADGDRVFEDNLFRFSLLCYAACEVPLVLSLRGSTYGDSCMFVANDWHASLVPSLLAAKYRPQGVHIESRCILVIHNLAYQGIEPPWSFPDIGLPSEWYEKLQHRYPFWVNRHADDKGESVNLLKGALVTADRIVAVSEGYASEIQTVDGGVNLYKVVASRASAVKGITNGIDLDEWNPATDRYISANYSKDDLAGKAICKQSLQEELGLPVSPNVPLVGFIGRLDAQKGPDIIQRALPILMADDNQMVMLGSGNAEIEAWMGEAERQYPTKFKGWAGFSGPLSHRITAGCDILLMPSRFEPCGLTQLYAMRYGTIPVVHATGGLRNTVQNFDPYNNGGQGSGTGWTFPACTKEALIGALWSAIGTYRNHDDLWRGLIDRAMSCNYSWELSAMKYEEIFQQIKAEKPYV